MLDIDLPLPPPDEAVRKLLSKVGGTLQQALDSRELKWSSKELDADDAKVVAYVVAASTVLQKLVLGANTIGDVCRHIIRRFGQRRGGGSSSHGS